MLTFQTTARVAQDRCLNLHLPTDLAVGEYEVLVVLEEKDQPERRLLEFSAHHLGSTDAETFSREDFYGDDGR